MRLMQAGLLTLMLLAAAMAARADDEAARAMWELFHSYDDAKARADADFAEMAAAFVERRADAFEGAYQVLQASNGEGARAEYTRRIDMAQHRLELELAPLREEWFRQMRRFTSRTVVELELQMTRRRDAGADFADLRDYQKVQGGLVHRWSWDAEAFSHRVEQMTAFRPEEPLDLASLLIAHPAVFDLRHRDRKAAPLLRPREPIPVVLWVLDDDNRRNPALRINGHVGRPHTVVERHRLSSYLFRYEFTLLPSDVVVIHANDRRRGAMGFWMADLEGNLISYSRPGLPATAGEAGLEQTSRRLNEAWEPARPIPRWKINQLRAVEGAPPSLPDDMIGIWLESSDTGQIGVIVYPFETD
jgi:hypothetical protein